MFLNSTSNGDKLLIFTGPFNSILAAISTFYIYPDNNYVGYIDLRVDVNDNGFTGKGLPQSSFVNLTFLMEGSVMGCCLPEGCFDDLSPTVCTTVGGRPTEDCRKATFCEPVSLR